MREGSLEAPTRHPLDWQSESFYDEAALDAELRRVFDICHGCRRCFNLCDSFPRLFDLIDAAPSEELDTVSSADFGPVVDACTLCDMCFMTKCPYVPPHEFDLDFPHLMLRAKAVKFRNGEVTLVDRQLAETDRNGKVVTLVSGIANWAAGTGNGLTRPLMQAFTGLAARADLPAYSAVTLDKFVAAGLPLINGAAPAHGRKAVLYATCFGTYNDQKPVKAAIEVLAHNGIDLEVRHPGCCGMPKLENGDIAGVAAQARLVAEAFEPMIDAGYDVVAPTPSCALMLKFEWPLILPDDPLIAKLAKATFDLSEYVVDIARKHGMAAGMTPLDGGIAVHFSCHARAQNMGPKALEMLRLIPESAPTLVERCSGHGGKWGYFKENFETALKVGTPAARQLTKTSAAHIVTECPLAGPHLRQVIDSLPGGKPPERVGHPIELVALSYGF